MPGMVPSEMMEEVGGRQHILPLMLICPLSDLRYQNYFQITKKWYDLS